MGIGYVIFALAPATGDTLPTLGVAGKSFTDTFQLMTLAMGVAGIGYSGIHPVGYPLISADITSEHKGKVLGMWGSASKIGDALAPLLVGLLIFVLPWDTILLLVAAFGFGYAMWLFHHLQVRSLRRCRHRRTRRTRAEE